MSGRQLYKPILTVDQGDFIFLIPTYFRNAKSLGIVYNLKLKLYIRRIFRTILTPKKRNGDLILGIA